MTPRAPVTSAKTLVIEDSWEMRLSFVAAFEDEGYQVFSAADGESGLRLFYEHSPDLVVLDLRMPGISGLDVLAEIRKTSDVPVIVLTALGDSETKEMCMQAGASDFVIKSGSLDLLMRCARKHVPQAA